MLSLEILPEVQLKPKLYFGMKFSNYLSQSELNFWQFVQILENDPFFRRLKKYIKIIPHHRYFLALPKEKADFTNFLDLETLLKGQEKAIVKTKLLGEDLFVRYFLQGDVSLKEKVKAITGLSDEELKTFADKVIRKIQLTEIIYPNLPAVTYHDSALIASITVEKGKLQVIYFLSRSRYQFKSERLQELIQEFSPEERIKFKEIQDKCSWINLRLNLINRLIDELVLRQEKYLLTGKEEDLAVWTQTELASKLEVHSSWISRLIKNKTVLTSFGEKLARFFFKTQKEINKRKGLNVLRKVLETAGKKSSADRLTKILQKDYSFKTSRRTVSLWRNILK